VFGRLAALRTSAMTSLRPPSGARAEWRGSDGGVEAGCGAAPKSRWRGGEQGEGGRERQREKLVRELWFCNARRGEAPLADWDEQERDAGVWSFVACALLSTQSSAHGLCAFIYSEGPLSSAALSKYAVALFSLVVAAIHSFAAKRADACSAYDTCIITAASTLQA
jgi:hypothetical protein